MTLDRFCNKVGTHEHPNIQRGNAAEHTLFSRQFQYVASVQTAWECCIAAWQALPFTISQFSWNWHVKAITSKATQRLFLSYCAAAMEAAVLTTSEMSICLSVCPCVRPSVKRVNCDKTKETWGHILTPHESTFILMFRHEERLVWNFTWYFGPNWPCSSNNADFQSIFCYAKFLCVKTVSDKVLRHSLAYLYAQKIVKRGCPYYVKRWAKLTHPFKNADFLMAGSWSLRALRHAGDCGPLVHIFAILTLL